MVPSLATKHHVLNIEANIQVSWALNITILIPCHPSSTTTQVKADIYMRKGYTQDLVALLNHCCDFSDELLLAACEICHFLHPVYCCYDCIIAPISQDVNLNE